MEETARIDNELILFLGLYLAKTLLDINLPDYVWQKVQSDTKIASLARMVCKQIFSERNGSVGILEKSLFHLKSIETLRERLRYCYYLAISPSLVEFEILKLPSYLFFLYYPFRTFRLLGKYSVGRLINSLFD